MFYLTNSATSVLQRALGHLPQSTNSEFGSRFQRLVAIALRAHPELASLYENFGAGQPDCYCNASGHGFEIKCRSQGTSVTMDDNSWRALPQYDKPRLVALLTVTPPYPLWVVDLKRMQPAPVSLGRDTPVDAELERHLKVELSALIEAMGANRIYAGDRDEFNARAHALAG